MNDIDDNYSFNITNADGVEMRCDALGTLEDEKGNCIIIYTDYTLDKDNKFNIFASKLVKDGDVIRLESVKDVENYPKLMEALLKAKDEMETEEWFKNHFFYA